MDISVSRAFIWAIVANVIGGLIVLMIFDRWLLQKEGRSG